MGQRYGYMGEGSVVTCKGSKGMGMEFEVKGYRLGLKVGSGRQMPPEVLDEAEGVVSTHPCRANMAHIRQSRPDYGLGHKVKSL